MFCDRCEVPGWLGEAPRQSQIMFGRSSNTCFDMFLTLFWSLPNRSGSIWEPHGPFSNNSRGKNATINKLIAENRWNYFNSKAHVRYACFVFLKIPRSEPAATYASKTLANGQENKEHQALVNEPGKIRFGFKGSPIFNGHVSNHYLQKVRTSSLIDFLLID